MKHYRLTITLTGDHTDPKQYTMRDNALCVHFGTAAFTYEHRNAATGEWVVLDHCAGFIPDLSAEDLLAYVEPSDGSAAPDVDDVKVVDDRPNDIWRFEYPEELDGFADDPWVIQALSVQNFT